MKRSIPFLLLLLICASAIAADAINTVPLHHFYQPKFDFHFYTMSDSDVAIVKADPNWRYLGIVGHVYPRSTPETVALMRLRKDEFGGVNHLYTVNMEEANHAIDTAGWREEGFGGYIAPSQLPGTVPLYRLYKPCVLPDDGKFRDVGKCEDATGGDVHIYVTAEADKNSALANGYRLVRIEGYIWPQPSSYAPAKAHPHLKVTPETDRLQIPLVVDLVDMHEGKQGYDYKLKVRNADAIPADWFAPLPVLPAERCWNVKEASNARLFLEIAWGAGMKAERRGDCRPLNSPADLNDIRYRVDGRDGVAKNVQLFVRDRLTNVRHASNLVPVAAFNLDSVLIPAGCSHFLGRAGEYMCKNATALAACNNLKNQGKPIVCRKVAR